MEKIIAVINQKGGVGKTTTSINLSCGLAHRGKKVILIDLDPQAHSTIGLGIERDDFNVAINDVLMKQADFEEILLTTRINNLLVAPSQIRLDKTEQELAPELFRESRLLNAIQYTEADYIIIDCRPTLGTLTVNALYACNFIIVPCEISRHSLDGFSDLLETIENVKNNDMEKNSQLLRILLTKFESRNKVSNEWVLNQLEPFNDLLFNTYIRKNEAINQAHMVQEPVLTFRPDSNGSKDYIQLTDEFLKL